MSDIVDRSFEGEDWEGRAFPTQHFPEEVLKLLGALNASRARGWLSAESHIRDLGAEGRIDLAKFLLLPEKANRSSSGCSNTNNKLIGAKLEKGYCRSVGREGYERDRCRGRSQRGRNLLPGTVFYSSDPTRA